MDKEEFQLAIKELCGEYTAPSEVAEVCARLFEAQRKEADALRARIQQLEHHLLQIVSNQQNRSGQSYW